MDETASAAPMEPMPMPMLGIVTTLPPPMEPQRVPKRAFPIGFHVAAPGPSHEEDDPPPRRRRPKAPPAEG